MNKKIFILISILLLTSGCAKKIPENTNSETYKNQTNSISDNQNNTLESEQNINKDNDTSEELYNKKAEKEAIDIDIEKLEADYHSKNIDKNTFIAQKTDLTTKLNNLELEIKELEIHQNTKSTLNSIPNSDNIKELVKQLSEYEIEEDKLDTEQEMLELQYETGEITREDFIKNYAVSKKNEDVVEKQIDILEDMIEILEFED